MKDHVNLRIGSHGGQLDVNVLRRRQGAGKSLWRWETMASTELGRLHRILLPHSRSVAFGGHQEHWDRAARKVVLESNYQNVPGCFNAQTEAPPW